LSVTFTSAKLQRKTQITKYFLLKKVKHRIIYIKIHFKEHEIFLRIYGT